MTLRELLSYRGKTQSQLAAALGVSQAMVSKWVRGDRKPKWQTAARIAGALGAEIKVTEAGFDYIPGEEIE
jgi:transcriptional regulator with XRE-family HTH domain